jgi:hypothetical protein
MLDLRHDEIRALIALQARAIAMAAARLPDSDGEKALADEAISASAARLTSLAAELADAPVYGGSYDFDSSVVDNMEEVIGHA